MHLVRLLAGTFVSVSLGLAQEPTFTLKVDVPFVSVDVTVADTNGKTIDNLPVSSFELYENGVRQDIRHFASVSTPYNVLLLFDRSGSTQDKWPVMQRAVAGFVANLRRQDRVAIAAFDSESKLLLPWTGDRLSGFRTLPELIMGKRIGGTEFYAAVGQVLRREFNKTTGRRALVVLTDGRDTSIYKYIVKENRLLDPKNDRPFQRVLKLAGSQRVPIYFVAFNTDKNMEPNSIGGDEYRTLQTLFPGSSMADDYAVSVRMRMEQLAEISGGRMLYPERLQDIVLLYQQIAHELGTSYTLGYISSAPIADGSFRTIQVRTHDSSLKLVQSRSGYYAKQ
jgi:VWFA-related protein